MVLVFQNKTNIEIVGFQLMQFGFALDSSDIDLLNIDSHLDLLDTDKHFVCTSKPVNILFVSKTS